LNDPLVLRAVTRCIWTGSSAGSLDPMKEVTAADLKVKCGFSTIERESSELNGTNYRDNIRQQSTEQGEFTEADLIYPPYRPSQVTTQLKEMIAAPPGEEVPPPPPAEPPLPDPTQPKPQPAQPPTPARAKLASSLSGRFHR
jgi:hypothetical protein